MELCKAKTTDFNTVRDIVHGTINTMYPNYYPQGAVEYLLDYHADEVIMADLEHGRVYLLLDDGLAVGTGSITENEIGRLFVRPECQGKGYGKTLLNFLENTVMQGYDEIVLYASLIAVNMYLNRGYKIIEYDKLQANYGHFLCFHKLKRSKDQA